jgi:integrase
VLALHSDEVAANVVRISPEKMKNRKWAIIPISRHVQQVLAGIDPAPYYFASRLGQLKPRASIYDAWRVAVDKTELEWMRPYDLRHFFASQLAKQGANEQQIGRLLCHVSGSVTSRYVHQDIEDLRGFVDELGRRFVAARRE